ncbi:hypothetical protein BJY24_000398 [Nocardia transvalensis]|uniref:Uncharacterized protein n=1 Tax=Nocardia transvalensis TaxID=37333 RepID=A0A7W9P8M8_9NOCA|nr:hypothetical protein [Nocardia transvalensis]MBB5911531.1 hypothetical protein [Nocardia transvalensis]
MTPPRSIERLLHELTTRYGSVDAVFVALDRLRADPGATTVALPVVLMPSYSGRHRAA